MPERGAAPTDVLDLAKNLSADETRFLASIAKRAYQSVIEEPTPRDLRSEPQKELPPRVRVATLALSLPDPGAYLKAGHEHGPEGKYLRNRIHYDYVQFEGGEGAISTGAVQDLVEDFLRQCAQREVAPHFLLLNELALCFHDGAGHRERWQALAEAYRVYIIPGTFHDSMTCFGVAPIFAPTANRKPGFSVKQNTAFRQGENIRTPDVRKLEFFHTDFGNIVVWICIDLYDPGLVLKYLSASYRLSKRGGHKHLHLALIPSFNGDSLANMKGFVQQLSHFSRTVIVCANSFTDKAIRRMEGFGYIAGRPLRSAWEPGPTPGDGESNGGASSGSSYSATVFEFDFAELHTAQATNFLTDHSWSSPFLAIVDGDAVIRPLPERPQPCAPE